MAETVTTNRTTTTKVGANPPRAESMCRVTVKGMEQAALNVVGLRDFTAALDAANAPGGTQIQAVKTGSLTRLEATWEFALDDDEPGEEQS